MVDKCSKNAALLDKYLKDIQFHGIERLRFPDSGSAEGHPSSASGLHQNICHERLKPPDKEDYNQLKIPQEKNIFLPSPVSNF